MELAVPWKWDRMDEASERQEWAVRAGGPIVNLSKWDAGALLTGRCAVYSLHGINGDWKEEPSRLRWRSPDDSGSEGASHRPMPLGPKKWGLDQPRLGHLSKVAWRCETINDHNTNFNINNLVTKIADPTVDIEGSTKSVTRVSKEVCKVSPLKTYYLSIGRPIKVCGESLIESGINGCTKRANRMRYV